MNKPESDLFTFKDVLTKSIAIFKSNLLEIITLSSVPFLAYTLLYIYSGDGSMDAILNIPLEIISLIYLLFFLSFLLSIPILINMVKSVYHGEFVDLKNSSRQAFLGIVKLLVGLLFIFLFMVLVTVLSILAVSFFAVSSAMVFILSILFAILGIKLYLDYIFTIHAMVLNKLSIVKALKYSKEISKRNRMKVINHYALVSIIVFFLVNTLSLFLSPLPSPLVYNLLIAFVQSLAMMFTHLFTTLLYISIEAKPDSKELESKE